MRPGPKTEDAVLDHRLPPAGRPGTLVGRYALARESLESAVESEDVIAQARGSSAERSIGPLFMQRQRLCTAAFRRVCFEALLLHETLDRPGGEAVPAAAGSRHAAATALHLALSLIRGHAGWREVVRERGKLVAAGVPWDVVG